MFNSLGFIFYRGQHAMTPSSHFTLTWNC